MRGITVTTIITSTELNPVTLIPATLLKKRRLRVTRAIDMATERTSLSILVTRGKKIRLQTKPGRKKTSKNPSAALMIGTPSRKESVKLTSSLNGESQSIPYFTLNRYPLLPEST